MIVGNSAAIRRAVAIAEHFAPTRLPILLVGAPGTGKELFAQHIHRVSRRTGELVDINCAALPRDMIDGLLFGFRKGAFTGADETHVGFIEQAHRGTLFLDELLSLPDEGQRKLLRVLETGEVRRLREPEKRSVDVRVVAAVQEDLRGLRADLYDRLRGVVIELPPLSKRPEDIEPLAHYFADVHGKRLEPGVLRELLDHSWPGNVRELQLAIERATQLVENGVLTAVAIAQSIRLGLTHQHPRSGEWGRCARQMECERLAALCEKHHGNWRSIAAELGIQHSALYERLRAAGLVLKSFRVSGFPELVHRKVTGKAESRGQRLA